MKKARVSSLGVVVLCVAGLLATACSKWGSEVKNDPVMSAKGAPKDIFAAAKTGDVNRVRELIESGDWDPTEMDGGARRPLDYAIEGGNAEIVGMMVQNGADPNTPGRNGMPLQYARKLGKKDVEQVLVNAGAHE